jgi:hypothetical protein
MEVKSALNKGILDNLSPPNNQVLFKNALGEKFDVVACKSYCESAGGEFKQDGWYIYCTKSDKPLASNVVDDSKKAGGADPKTTKTAAAATGESPTTPTGESIPKESDRYFEVGVQTPFSKPPTDSEAGEGELIAKWKADGYTQCEDGQKDNTNCDFKCATQRDTKGAIASILCENLSSGEAWRYKPSGDGKTGKWQQVIRGVDGNEILTTYATLIYRWLAGFIGLVAVLLIVVGGVMISTAGANQEGMESGKKLITSALAGLALLFVSSLILYTVNPTFFSSGEGIRKFEEVTPYTVVAPTAATTAPLAEGEYTHAEAMTNLNKGYSVTSTTGAIGVGTDRNTSKTTLEGIKKDTISGANALIEACGGSGWSITGASELTGHEANSTHYTGQAIDLQKNSNTSGLQSCMSKYTKPSGSGITSSGQPYSKLQIGNYNYWVLNEDAKHYHIEVNTKNAA